jgi:hypothetical protein
MARYAAEKSPPLFGNPSTVPYTTWSNRPSSFRVLAVAMNLDRIIDFCKIFCDTFFSSPMRIPVLYIPMVYDKLHISTTKDHFLM